MERHWIRGVILTLAIAAAVWFGLTISSEWMDRRGVSAGCISLASQASSAVLPLLGLMILLTILGMVVARLINAVVGVFVVGAGFAALDMRSAPISSAVFDGVAFSSIGLETLIWTIPIALCVVLIFRAGGPLPDIAPRNEGNPLFREYFDLDALRASLLGVLMPVVVWLVVRTMLKGQALGGACAGGIAVGMAFRMMAPRVQPVMAFISPILVMGAYQVFFGRGATNSMAILFANNAIGAEFRLLPMDTIAGTLTGVAIGIGWARNFRRSDTISS